ncbi:MULTISPECIES: restriction endonuclease subunit S [Klebsiella]|nr:MULTISPECIES: restriction endonuclease subunit S [Klebsiella]EKW0783042.1 restriction endonuclease subunit S [Klebsiella michiganensis]MBX4820055.1 restriction endonuclease subunit S [Klebsiella michiganensis]MDX6054920.1 restriction endonuclease subunit S [Klebsiella sp. JN_Kp126]
MGSKWIEVSLGEISEKIGDGIHGTPVYNDSGNYYFINGSNLSDNSIKITDTTKRVDHDEFLKHRKELGDNTVLVSINGTIGNTALYNNENIILGKSACYINLKDSISKYFILYILSGYLFQEYIQRCSTGSTIKNVSLKMMRDFRFLMPESKEDQEKAVYIIQKVDERKRLSNAQNQTLEQMSKTLFKSWFVDFDPVIDNALDTGNPIPEALQSRAELRQKARNSADFKPLPADLRALFPAEFEETEMGWVPKGWSVTELGQLVTVKRGGSPRPIHDFLRADGFPWVKISDATASSTRFLMSTKEFIKSEGLNKTVFLKKGSLILSNSATPGLPKFLDIEACIHDGWLYFPEKEKLTDVYLYNLFLEIKEQLISQGNGSVFTNLKTDILKQFKITVPGKDIISYFDKLGTELHKKILDITKNTETLTALRDTLLPKLISGELSLEDLPDLVTQTEPA